MQNYCPSELSKKGFSEGIFGMEMCRLSVTISLNTAYPFSRATFKRFGIMHTVKPFYQKKADTMRLWKKFGFPVLESLSMAFGFKNCFLKRKKIGIRKVIMSVK